MRIIINGYPKTFERSDLYAQADRLCMSGQHDEGRLLRALLDNYAPSAEAQFRDEVEDLKRDLKEAEAARDSADLEAVKQDNRRAALEEAAREALEAVEKALAYRHEKDAQRANAELARAVGALSSALK